MVEQMTSHSEEPQENCHVSAAWDLLLQSAECPDSYRMNSPDETHLLTIADDFQRQFSLLFPERKPLLLCPINECGVKKFVSTSLQPMAPSLPELFSWEGCASFVADFLSVDPLEPPVELPRFQFSSSTVLVRQRGSCLEFSSLLCSLLLGAGYDAYCVCGYAVREMCLQDQRLQDCPLLDSQVQAVSSVLEQQDSISSVKAVSKLRSRFVMQQEKKIQEAEAALLQQTLQEGGHSTPDDPLQGLRVYCWVLVLSGSRSVQENFFIDPLTGRSYSTTHSHFLGIESIWNNLNYYVNMKDCRNGCTELLYDLEDPGLWESLLFGASSRKQLLLDVLKKKESQLLSRISPGDQEDEQLPNFHMPRSWVSPISLSAADMERRFPGGQKTSHYRKAKLEQFSPYLRPDGLCTRLTSYTYLDCREVLRVQQWYRYRKDHLEFREINMADGFTSERFTAGRRFHLLFHRYKDLGTVREMHFSGVGLDGLVRRVESAGEMTETFEGRDDFLYHRHSMFDRHIQFTDADMTCDPPLLKVVERFHRNRKILASEDVAERVFLLSQRRIEVTYHLEAHRFISSKRSFIKPRESTETQKEEEFTADMVSSFQVDPAVFPLNVRTLYELLSALMSDEKKVILQIQESKKEMKDIVTLREQEETDVQLHFSTWTTTGAARARLQRQEVERVAAEDQRWLQEKEEDILAPLLLRLDSTDPLSPSAAEQLYQDCLQDFKHRLVEQAQLIQERYEKETQQLQNRQQWFQKNQVLLTVEQEDEYQTYCSQKTLQIHVSKRRLSIHRDTAPQKLRALDQRLKRDARLAPHISKLQIPT